MRNCDAKVYHGGGVSNNRYSSMSSSADDILVKASLADTTADYLMEKMSAGPNITTTLINPGADEQVQVAGLAGGEDNIKNYDVQFDDVGSIAAGTLIESDSGNWAAAGQGHYIGASNIELKEIHVLVNRYVSYNSAHKIEIQIKKISGAGRSTVITSASGTCCGTVIVTFPSTSGNFGYYRGGCVLNLTSSISAGDFIFAACMVKDVNSATGIDVHVLLQETIPE